MGKLKLDIFLNLGNIYYGNLRNINTHFRNVRRFRNSNRCLSNIDRFYDDDVEKIFRGQLRSTYQCEKCKHETEISEEFLDLSLSVPVSRPLVKLESCLDLQFQQTQLTGKRKRSCRKCKNLQNAQREVKILGIPDSLVLHLNRFRRENSMTKKNLTQVQFPVDINLGRWSLAEDGIYKLYGVICHHGSSVNSGHYTSYVFNKTRKSWLKCDDENVTEVVVTKVVCGSTFRSAYMLFYDRVCYV